MMRVYGVLLFLISGLQYILCGVNPKVDSTGAPIAFKPECTKTYNKTGTGPNFVISTPNFPSPYDNNIRCGWTIESPEEAADISIKFHSFNVESSKRCAKYDYVMLYQQGNGQNDWDQIGYLEGYCGKQDSFTVSATAKRVFIKFFADSSRAFSGFNATYEIHITQAAPAIICLGREGDKTCNNTVNVEEREIMTVSCNARAIPPATYDWEKLYNDTAPLNMRSGFVKTKFPNGSLQIQDLQLTDQGYYRCTATNKHGSHQQKIFLKVAEKCRCKKEIRVSWHPKPPYTKYMRAGQVKGIFYHILTDMIKEVCGNCAKGHGYSNLLWLDGKNNRKTRGLSEVKSEIENSEADIYLPIEGLKTDDRYRNVYYFLPVVDSPGIALLVIGTEEGASAMAIFDSIVQGWPILVLTVVMAVLAGIIMWMLDTYWNEEQFPRTFSEGIIEGFWWAFVTMTTVGYGDIAPVGVPGRLFAVIWILTGLVIIAIFTGVITTSLTVTALSNDLQLYGATIGALNNSAEHRMGVIKNAKMTRYFTYDEMKAGMDGRFVEGSLIDSYAAAYHKDLFSKFRVNNIFSANKAYGIVLGEDMSKDGIPDLMYQYLETRKSEITKMVEENVDTLEEPKSSAAEEASAELFNPKSTIFVKSMIASGIILLILTIGGLFFEYGYLRPRHRMIEAAKNLEMVESTEVKEMARRARLLKETLLLEVQEFYDRWAEKLGNLTKKHKAEQKKLLQHGKGSGPPPVAEQQRTKQQQQHAEEAVELEGTDTVDKPSSAGSSGSSHTSSQHTLVKNQSQTEL